MVRKKQDTLWDINIFTELWGKILHEFSNEDGKKVRIFENGCSTIGEPNPAACSDVSCNILQLLITNPSLIDPEIVTKDGCIQIYFSD